MLVRYSTFIFVTTFSAKAAGNEIIGIDLGTTNSCLSIMEEKVRSPSKDCLCPFFPVALIYLAESSIKWLQNPRVIIKEIKYVLSLTIHLDHLSLQVTCFQLFITWIIRIYIIFWLVTTLIVLSFGTMLLWIFCL